MLTIDLTCKVALVVGGSRGIGRGITETLAKAGAKVTFTHTGNPEYQDALKSWLDRISETKGQVTPIVADACDEAGMKSCVERLLETEGKIDLLVHNVGQNYARPVEAATLEEWRRFTDINLTSAFISVSAVLPSMLRANYGRIVLIGSSAVFDGGGGAIDYAAPKAGLVGMMAYLTRAYTRKGILTNVIHPCVIETDLLRERYDDPEKKAKLIEQVPVGRLGQPEDIAGLVAYLASSWGDFICGQAILVDGGRTLYK